MLLLPLLRLLLLLLLLLLPRLLLLRRFHEMGERTLRVPKLIGGVLSFRGIR